MRKFSLIMLGSICLGLLLFALSVSPAADVVAAETQSALPVGTLSTQEVVKLFSGNTVESVTAVRERTSFSYYDPNGEIRQSRNGKTRRGHWRVNAKGQMCLQMEGLPEKCRIIVFEEGEYRKYIVKKNGQHQHSVTYRNFLRGNPYGL